MQEWLNNEEAGDEATPIGEREGVERVNELTANWSQYMSLRESSKLGDERGRVIFGADVWPCHQHD